MSEEKKEYDKEMRGALFEIPKAERVENGPIYRGKIRVSGVDLRVFMWPGRKATSGKAAGLNVYGLTVEYPQGAKHFLAKVSPANVVVTGAMGSEGGEGAASEEVGDMPF